MSLRSTFRVTSFHLALLQMGKEAIDALLLHFCCLYLLYCATYADMCVCMCVWLQHPRQLDSQFCAVNLWGKRNTQRHTIVGMQVLSKFISFAIFRSYFSGK